MLKFNLRLLPWHLPSVGLSGPENTRCEIGDERQRGKSSKAFSEPPSSSSSSSSPSPLSLLLSATSTSTRTSTSLHFDCFVFFNIVVVVVVGPSSFYRRRADVFQPHSSSFGFCCSSPPTIKKTTDGRQEVKQKRGESPNSKKKSFSWNKFRNETSFWIFYSFGGCNFFPLRLIYGAEDQVCLQLWCPLSPPTQAPPRPVPALLL